MGNKFSVGKARYYRPSLYTTFVSFVHTWRWQFWHRGEEVERVILRKCRRRKKTTKIPAVIAPDLSHDWVIWEDVKKCLYRICSGNIHSSLSSLLTLKHRRSKCFNCKTSQLKSINWRCFPLFQFVLPLFPFAVNWSVYSCLPYSIAWSILYTMYFHSKKAFSVRKWETRWSQYLIIQWM